VREIKKREIETYFAQLRLEANFIAKSNLIVKAAKEFKEAFQKMQPSADLAERQKILQNYYLTEWLSATQHPRKDTFRPEDMIPKDYRSILLQTQYLIGNKSPFEELSYHQVHQTYHESITGFARTLGYYDVMLIEDRTGYIIYSLKKEIDFATSLLNGNHANTHAGKLFRQIRYTGSRYQTIMTDFERYLPSYFAPTAFIAAAVFDGEVKIGTLIFQLPIDKIDAVTTSKRAWTEEGLGESGECYIVGKDKKMRTDSRFMIESSEEFLNTLQKDSLNKKGIDLMQFYKTTILFQKVDNPAVTKAIARQTGMLPVKDYRGVEVLSSFTPLAIADVNWALIAEIDAQEAYQPVRDFAWRSLGILLLVGVIIAITAILLARSIYKPLLKLVSGTEELGKGNLDIKIDIIRKDEIGALADSFNQTILRLKDYREETLHKTNILEQQKEEITTQSETLKRLNEEVTQINNYLEEKVRERTQNLQEQNEKLAQYAFLNSHRLRAPVANILGLVNLIHACNNIEEKILYLSKLEQATKELDSIVHEIQQLIDEAEFKEGDI
jgi:methyl-accepting chemotaxis protein